jgi:hypothetical protein
MILDEIVTLLVNDSDVNDLIAGRVYTQRAPDDVTKPYVTLTLIFDGRLTVLEGGAATQNPASVQFDTWADTLDGAIDLADKVETALVGSSTFAVGDLSRQTDYDPEILQYRMIIDASLWT